MKQVKDFFFKLLFAGAIWAVVFGMSTGDGALIALGALVFAFVFTDKVEV